MASSSSLAPSSRTGRLTTLFDSYTKGSRAAKTPSDGKLLLEAIVIRKDTTECIERLVGSNNAIEELRVSLRFDNTPSFSNTTFKDFFMYLQDPVVKQLCSGMLYR